MDGEMLNDKSEENETLELRKIVVPQLEIKNNGVRLALQNVHRLADVYVIGEFAYYVETEFLHRAYARRYRRVRRTILHSLGERRAAQYQTKQQQASPDLFRDTSVSEHLQLQPPFPPPASFDSVFLFELSSISSIIFSTLAFLF